MHLIQNGVEMSAGQPGVEELDTEVINKDIELKKKKKKKN